jgi:hypothetical protein
MALSGSVLCSSGERDVEIREIPEATDYDRQESYLAALLETDRAKMLERVHAAEADICNRQRVLSEDYGGTAEERQAIVDAINGMNVLRREAAESKNRKISER